MRKQVFILGTDNFNLRQLESVRGAERCEFHSLSDFAEIRHPRQYPVREVLAQSRDRLARFPQPVDAIIGWWDFPVSTMLPILRRQVGAPGPSLEAVLKCEHKYFSRLEQQACIPAHVPAFRVFDPMADDPLAAIELDFPFWIKPVKAASSYLGFYIPDAAHFRHALARVRTGIDRLAGPFDEILRYASLTPDRSKITGRFCIAESIISRGRQCTLEGYVHHGVVTVYGIVDSVREGRHGSCFARYQYPSSLPARIHETMVATITRFLGHIGFDDSPFNAEFFWEPDSDHTWLLEVNTRISKSHCPLFKLVDGEYHHAVNLAVCLGEEPQFPHRQGRYPLAAKFMLRRFADAIVRKVPSAADINAVERAFPGLRFVSHVAEGTRLSELKDQDSYSFE
ncbi:MAG: D-alanine--D-alanine ligase, partial [Gammaproteobacteria bacterium]